jgi:hypothetical protein
LNDIAPEIPVLLDTAERRQEVRAIVEACCTHGPSWVSLDERGNIVGFLLGTKITVEVWQMEFSGLALVYGGVTIAQRGCGRFTDLLAQAKRLGLPLRAVVKRTNKGNMVERLTRERFASASSLRPDEHTFVWTPGCMRSSTTARRE